jgi:hypothetical protein
MGAKVRVRSKKPKQPATWLPDVLELFKQKGQVTSGELATVVGKSLGGDAVTRCRQVGLPIEPVGLLQGSGIRRKLYALDGPLLWLALEEAVRQLSRYARVLNLVDRSERRSFPSAAAWIAHVKKTAPEPQEKQR